MKFHEQMGLLGRQHIERQNRLEEMNKTRIKYCINLNSIHIVLYCHLLQHTNLGGKRSLSFFLLLTLYIYTCFVSFTIPGLVTYMSVAQG